MKGGVEVTLTAREWAVLECFTHRLGATVSKAKLEEILYAFGAEIESNAVEGRFTSAASARSSELGRSEPLRGLGYRMDR